MTITEKAKKYSAMFVTDTRVDGKEFVKCTNDATQPLKESVRQAHGSRMPDDWTYGTYADLMQRVTDYDLETFDQLEDVRHEIVDGYVDIYTSDLTAWLNESNDNVYYLTEVLEQGLEPKDGFQLLAMAQYQAIDEVMSEVVDLLQKDFEDPYLPAIAEQQPEPAF